MPIDSVAQPDFICIDDSLRLRKYDGSHAFALAWYQDLETVWLVDGDNVPYTEALLEEMFTYWNRMGEVYFIEVLQNGHYQPIGDVTFLRQDMPILIGEKAFRGKGIGTKVVGRLIERARELGYTEIEVEEIYRWNTGSQRLFENHGFVPHKKTEKGMGYKLVL